MTNYYHDLTEHSYLSVRENPKSLDFLNSNDMVLYALAIEK